MRHWGWLRDASRMPGVGGGGWGVGVKSLRQSYVGFIFYCRNSALLLQVDERIKSQTPKIWERVLCLVIFIIERRILTPNKCDLSLEAIPLHMELCSMTLLTRRKISIA